MESPFKNIRELVWVTKAGLPAVVIMTSLGHRCGYVAVPPSHPLSGLSYGEHSWALDGETNWEGKNTVESSMDVHGGITFSGTLEGYKLDIPLEKYWWFGYDCAHSWDIPSPEYLAWQNEAMPSLSRFMREGTHRDLDYCIEQCESLAAQLKAVPTSKFRAWCRRMWAAFKDRVIPRGE